MLLLFLLVIPGWCSNKPNDLSGCGGSSDGFKESDGIEGLIGRAAECRIVFQGGDEITVDGPFGRLGVSGCPAVASRGIPPQESGRSARSRPISPKYSRTNRAPGESAADRHRSGCPVGQSDGGGGDQVDVGVATTLDGPDLVGDLPGGPQQGVDQGGRRRRRGFRRRSRPDRTARRSRPGPAWSARGGPGSRSPAVPARSCRRPVGDGPRRDWGRADIDGRPLPSDCARVREPTMSAASWTLVDRGFSMKTWQPA